MSEKIVEKTEKSEDKKDIEMEEREQMLNAENKMVETERIEESGEEKKGKTDIKEGMEVKPKKIPIGGIQMPGFFTRSKSKEKCRDDQEEGTELTETSTASEDPPPQPRIKLPNPFRKSKILNEEDTEKPQETQKKKLLDTIRLPLPLVSVFPRKKKDEQKLESQTQAGLASMETLDDKSTEDKGNEEMKNVNLDEKKDLEAQDNVEETSWRQKLKPYKVAIIVFLLFILLISIIVAIVIPRNKEVLRESPVRDGKYVEAVTSCGKVEGLVEDSAIAFRGIPYARPPIGELRFKYARPLNNIDYCWNGTFLAHNATPTCLQIHSNGTVSGTEDCLTLDVVTPYVRYTDPVPVVVLIGAESLIGGSPGKLRPSARYTRLKDVVFVRPNFRLGALGFLALEVLSQSDYPPTSGNYGLSDILEALHWVQLNIEHFGGDKGEVTLLGHGAGATLVTALVTIPHAGNYFARAWASSGGALYPNKTRPEAEIENRSFLQLVDCQDAECLMGLEAETIVRAVQDTWRKPQPDLPSVDEDPAKRHEWLVIDGRILKETPSKNWREGDLGFVIGTTAHADASQKLLLKHKNWTEFLVKKHIQESFLASKNLTDAVLEMYPKTYKGLSAMISDIRTVCPLLHIMKQMSLTPFYVVTQTRGDHDLADFDSDIDAILGRYEPKTPEQKRYVSAMQGFFYHFVWFGRVENIDVRERVILLVGQDVLPNSTYSHCDFWIEKGVVPKYAALD